MTCELRPLFVLARLVWRPVLVLAAASLVASCEHTGTLAGGGAQSDYLVARRALENGNYVVAIRHYERLLEELGADAGYLQLEYAHSLLRANRFDDAVRQASLLIDVHSGALRGSALAVRGTALHERARLMSVRGDDDTRSLLERADEDLSAFLASNAELDAGGAMRARRELVRADLRRQAG